MLSLLSAFVFLWSDTPVRAARMVTAKQKTDVVTTATQLIAIDANETNGTFHTRGCSPAQIKGVLQKITQMAAILSRMETSCGASAKCLYEAEGDDGDEEDAKDTQRAQALVDTNEAFQSALKEVEQCGPSVEDVDLIDKEGMPILQQIEASMNRLMSKSPELKNAVDNAEYEADKKLMPMVYDSIDSLPQDNAEFKNDAVRLLKGFDTTKIVEVSPPVEPLPEPPKHEEAVAEAQEVFATALAEAAEDPPDYTVQRAKTRAVRHMWCSSQDGPKACKQHHGHSHRSCYRLAGPSSNKLLKQIPTDKDPRLWWPNVNIDAFPLAKPYTKVEENEWGVCSSDDPKRTRGLFEKRVEVYKKWQTLKIPYPIQALQQPTSSGMLELQGNASMSASIVELESNASKRPRWTGRKQVTWTPAKKTNIVVGGAVSVLNVLSTVIHYAFTGLMHVIKFVFKILLTFWKLGAQFFGFFGGKKMQWIVMQPGCIVYKVGSFLFDGIRIIAGNIMNWCTQFNHWGAGTGVDHEWSKASDLSQDCFSEFPKDPVQLKPLPETAEDRKFRAEQRRKLQEQMVWEHQHVMNVCNGIPTWNRHC